jgi:hypothetical protein
MTCGNATHSHAIWKMCVVSHWLGLWTQMDYWAHGKGSMLARARLLSN